MKRTSFRMGLCVTLLIVNLLFIWGNSCLPGDVSGQLSEWVKGVLSCFFPFGEDDPQASSHLLRKLAHFSEFACLGACLSWLWGMWQTKGIASVLLPLFCGFSAACVDETIQIFVPGRGSSLIDVGIDTAGVATGIALLLIGYHIIKSKNRKHRRVTK